MNTQNNQNVVSFADALKVRMSIHDRASLKILTDYNEHREADEIRAELTDEQLLAARALITNFQSREGDVDLNLVYYAVRQDGSVLALYPHGSAAAAERYFNAHHWAEPSIPAERFIRHEVISFW